MKNSLKMQHKCSTKKYFTINHKKSLSI